MGAGHVCMTCVQGDCARRIRRHSRFETAPLLTTTVRLSTNLKIISTVKIINYTWCSFLQLSAMVGVRVRGTFAVVIS